jgi:flavin reductase (DIM6/NTAB) family NADH-FMN oxidoreductase RutF
LGGRVTIPMIKECPVNLACQVVEKFEIYNVAVRIGQVVET